MAAYPLGALIFQASLLAAIVLMCVYQAYREKTDVIAQLQRWQTSIAVAIGFSAAIWTMSFDVEKVEMDKLQHAWRIMDIATLESNRIEENATGIKFWFDRAIKSREKNDVTGCMDAMRQAQENNLGTVDLFQENKSDLTYLPPEYAVDIFSFFETANELQQRMARLDPEAECRLAHGSVNFIFALGTTDNLRREYRQMIDRLTNSKRT